jgi:hypothetical protein
MISMDKSQLQKSNLSEIEGQIFDDWETNISARKKIENCSVQFETSFRQVSLRQDKCQRFHLEYNVTI